MTYKLHLFAMYRCSFERCAFIKYIYVK